MTDRRETSRGPRRRRPISARQNQRRALTLTGWDEGERIAKYLARAGIASRREAEAMIARGEGIHMGTDDLYFCSTSGGAARFGQVFRLVPGRGTGPDRVELFFESESGDQFNYGDNLCVSPNGHLLVCEDQYTNVVDNHIRGITPSGTAYAFARLTMQTELAGGCFSPDGKWFFVNAYAPTRTVAITGPWAA